MKRIFAADFETTVYDGQINTEVWAAACVELNTEDVMIFHSIGEQLDYFKSLKKNLVVYFHNLKFDGSFILSHFLVDLGYKHAAKYVGFYNNFEWLSNKNMQNNTFKYSISEMGQWYSITLKVNGYYIEFRDSLKLMPFTLREIGKSFQTKHQKLEMEYVGYRYAGCPISAKERAYISNDVLVLKEALEIMFAEGHDKMTIGACCLYEYKKICEYSSIYELRDWKDVFPDVYQIKIPYKTQGAENAGEWIKNAYKGGWCYVAKGKENRIYHNGTTADVNSLYPSMMSSESGNRYPVGRPHFWSGNYIPWKAQDPECYYFIRIQTKFNIKKNHLPFIQIKNTLFYKGNECLETSKIYNPLTGEYMDEVTDKNGNKRTSRVILTLTMTDFELLKDQYDLEEFEILGGCWFYSMIGIFDEYIDKYRKIKMESKGARRTLAKLFLNNLYGKMASSTDSSFKVAYVKPDLSLGFTAVNESKKKPVYIPVGAAITSYARNFTIRAAQANYYGVDKPGFIYADTDSIHCDLAPEDIKGIKVHAKNFCCWDLESCWDKAIFARQKTYIEHVTHEHLEKIDNPYNNIKCAGMPDKCKNLLDMAITEKVTDTEKMSEQEKEFLFDDNGNLKKKDYTDFTIGLVIPGKLMPKRIQGGVLLVESDYTMR